MENGTVEIPYKFPYLEAIRDLKDLIEADGISDFNVVEIFRAMSLIIQEDCEICNNSPEIQEISSFTEEVFIELRSLIGSILFKNTALDRTSDTNVMFTNLPESIKARVESTSNIVESFNKGIWKQCIYM